jgi:hypothetical protein
MIEVDLKYDAGQPGMFQEMSPGFRAFFSLPSARALLCRGFSVPLPNGFHPVRADRLQSMGNRIQLQRFAWQYRIACPCRTDA